MWNKYLIYIGLILMFLIASCSQRSNKVIPEGKMIDILSDIQLAQALRSSPDKKSNVSPEEWREILIASILKKHNVSQVELDSSLVWYSDNILVYLAVSDSVVDRLKRDTNILQNRINKLSIISDNDRSILPTLYYLNSANSTLAFKIDSVDMGKIHLSSFNFSFDIQGLSSDLGAKAAVYYKYKDTLISESIQLRENTHYSFVKPELPDSLLKAISGYIHLRKKDISPFTNVLIYNITYQDSVWVQPLEEKIDREPHDQTKSFLRRDESISSEQPL